MKIIKITSMLVGLIIGSTSLLSAQTKKGLGLDASMYFNSNQEIDFSTSITYNWLLNRHISLSAGAMFFYLKPDLPGWNTESGIGYELNDNVMHFNGVVSATFMQPVITNTGLYVNGSFFFEPIPLNYISIDKNVNSNGQYNSKSIGKFRYSAFSPGVFAETGIYHDLKRGNKILKLFIGFGVGWYDIYSAYRNYTIDNQKLSNYISNEKVYYRLSVRLAGF